MARTRAPRLRPAPTNLLRLEGETIVFTPETGGCFMGTVEAVNAVLTALGYEEIAVRINMMSRLPYIEARNTSLACSPASETYWSM